MCIHNKIYYNIKRTKKLKTGLGTSYYFRPGNGDDLFWFWLYKFVTFELLTYLDI